MVHCTLYPKMRCSGCSMRVQSVLKRMAHVTLYHCGKLFYYFLHLRLHPLQFTREVVQEVHLFSHLILDLLSELPLNVQLHPRKLRCKAFYLLL